VDSNRHPAAGGSSPVTEAANPRSEDLAVATALESARTMNAEDRRVAEAVGEVLPQVAAAIDAVVERMRAGGRLFYVGAGTSGRLGVLDASECPPTFGVPPDLVQGVIAGGYDACHRAVEASEDDEEQAGRDLEARGATGRDAIVGLTASGRTPYAIGALRWARRHGALAVAVACSPDSPAEREADIAIVPDVGPEVLAGSTRLKAGTAQKLVLNMLSTLTMARLGYTLGNRMARLRTTNRKLAERAEGILVSECGVGADEARKTLRAAGGELATALVMLKARATPEEARRRLDAAGGSVARALESD
jgi:N-acetylmuramic acid 6-phosphate etherase